MSRGHSALLQTALSPTSTLSLPSQHYLYLILRNRKLSGYGKFRQGHFLEPIGMETVALILCDEVETQLLVKTISSMYLISLKVKCTASGDTNGNTVNILSSPEPVNC